MKRPIKFGDYYLFERVAIGGMAEVFKAASYGVEAFERFCAIKRVLPQISEDQEFIDMFIDEAKIAVQLSHANIGQVFELGNAGGAYFIAMEFVSGKDTRAIFDRIRSRGDRLDIAMCCHVVKEVCEALEYAHNKRNEVGDPLNLIHRDVSPQNVLVSYDGEVKLIDFGIAKAAGKANKTQAGILKGKFGYMSPEQVRGKPIDRRSDIFSLAVVLYELLTLERCFQGADDFSTLEKVRKVDFRRPTLLNRSIPPELERIIYRGLTRNPADRFQSAADFQDALQKFLYQSGSFYSRKDLASFMTDTFARELTSENEKTAQYREYARANIMEARRKASIPEEVLSMDSLLESTDLQSFDAALSESGTDTESDVSIVDRTTEETPGGRRTPSFQLGPEAGFPDDAETIPRETGRRPAQKPATARRMTWLIIITVFALVAGGLTIMYALERLSPATVFVETNTSTVQVYVDGRLRHDGPSPISIDKISSGTHRIVFQSAGHETRERRLNLKPGEKRRLRIRMPSTQPKTSLALTTYPSGAVVYIDGKKIDETPLRIADMKPGKHDLRIEKTGYSPYQATINLEPGTSGRVDPIRLYPERVTMTFITEPAQATLSVKLPDANWRKLGPSPQTLSDAKNSGRVKVKAQAAGYVTTERMLPRVLRLRHEEIITMEKKAAPPPTVEKVRPNSKPSPRKRRPGRSTPVAGPVVPEKTNNPKFCRAVVSSHTGLSVSSLPKALVFIDGAELGWGPILNRQVTAGHHAVLLVRQTPPEFRDSFSVIIPEGHLMRCIYKRKVFRNE